MCVCVSVHDDDFDDDAAGAKQNNNASMQAVKNRARMIAAGVKLVLTTKVSCWL